MAEYPIRQRGHSKRFKLGELKWPSTPTDPGLGQSQVLLLSNQHMFCWKVRNGALLVVNARMFRDSGGYGRRHGSWPFQGRLNISCGVRIMSLSLLFSTFIVIRSAKVHVLICKQEEDTTIHALMAVPPGM
jgi:hypothetical protein